MSGRRFEIRTTRSSKEWSEWCTEKSADAVRLIARALSVARRGDAGPPGGSEPARPFPELVSGPRDDDFEQILFELQLIAETQRMREQRELRESQEKLIPELVEK